MATREGSHRLLNDDRADLRSFAEEFGITGLSAKEIDSIIHKCEEVRGRKGLAHSYQYVACVREGRFRV
jgi:hypothetical protein